MRPLEKSPFSQHFNMLVWLGGWLPETDDPWKENFFVVYKLLLNSLSAYGCYALFLDFYMVLGDLKKMAWNLCVSILFVGAFTKTLQMVNRKSTINGFRLKLHQNAESKSSPEYVSIHRLALRELQLLRISFYGFATIFVPIWLLTRYFNQKRELPVPLHLPFEFDQEDDRQYVCVFILVGTMGIFGLAFGLETELAMFSIFIQLSREYRILNKDISKLNLIYDKSDSVKSTWFNPVLRRLKTNMMIKELSIRQKEIIEITEAFESCYNQAFLHQFFGISVLIVLIGVQCMLETMDEYGVFLYQIGYLGAVTMDIFMMCCFSTRLKTLCSEVGETVYFTHWYKMEVKTRRDLAMIILRSQHPPKVTTGKLMELSVTAFMHRMSNICSWLALLRELQINMTPKKPGLKSSD